MHKAKIDSLITNKPERFLEPVYSTITDTPWDRAPVTESEETVVAAWHVPNTCKEDSAISSDSVTGALSHGVSVIVECLCTRRRSTH
jgi:hypothetical protein